MITESDLEHRVTITIDGFMSQCRIGILHTDEGSSEDDLDWIFRKLEFMHTASSVDGGSGLVFDFQMNGAKTLITITGNLVEAIRLLARFKCISQPTQDNLVRKMGEFFSEISRTYAPYFHDISQETLEAGRRAPTLFCGSDSK